MGKKTFKKKYNDYMFEHTKLKLSIEYIYSLFMVIFSAFVFSYGFRAFIQPVDSTALHLASGGVSGSSQIVVKAIQLIFGDNVANWNINVMQSILYIVLNIPIFILAWKGIGRRFALLSLVNVLSVSLFIAILPDSFVNVFNVKSDDYLSRALFSGICTGLSSSIAFAVDGSAGGMDIISYYFAIKKSTSVGKYMFSMNCVIIVIFTILSYFTKTPEGTYNTEAWKILIYTAIYIFASSTVVDAFCIRNKKTQIQIFSNKENLAQVLISTYPHGCTIVDAKGAFSGDNVKILYMIVSSFEVKKVVETIQQVDPNAFINVTAIQQVYGKFFIKPIK